MIMKEKLFVGLGPVPGTHNYNLSHSLVCKILVVLAFVKENCSLAGNNHPYFCIKSVHKQTEPFRKVTWVEVFLAIIAALYLCAEDCLVSLI